MYCAFKWIAFLLQNALQVPKKKFKVNVEGSINQWSPYNPFMSRTPNRVKIEKVIAEAPEHLQEVLSLLQLSSVHMHALAVVVPRVISWHIALSMALQALYSTLLSPVP